MSPEPRRNFSNQQRFGGGGGGGGGGGLGDDDIGYLRPSPPSERPAGTTDTAMSSMSSHTRMMLDKLKQSTAQLQDLTEGGEEVSVPPRRGNRQQQQQQKKSRFMLRPKTMRTTTALWPTTSSG